MKSVLEVFILVLAMLSEFAVAQSAATSNEPLTVVQHGLYGYIDHAGNVLIQPQFLWATDFENGYGVVYVCGRYVLIDKRGKVSPINAPRTKSGLTRKKVGDKFGFVDGNGELKIKPLFDEVQPFAEGLAAARVGDRWGFIDSSGTFVIAPRFDGASDFREGVVAADLDETTVLIDKSGKELARGYEMLSGITSESRIPVSQDDKYGYLDLTGALVIPLKFDQASTFSEGLAAVQKGSKWGYIDTSGAIAIPFKFDTAGEFGNGLAPVKMGNDSGFIDHTGSFAFHLAFENAPGFWGSDYISDVSRFWTKDDDFGFVNTSGKVIWRAVREFPEESPVLGWSDEEKLKSCSVVPESVRKAVLAFPPEKDD